MHIISSRRDMDRFPLQEEGRMIRNPPHRKQIPFSTQGVIGSRAEEGHTQAEMREEPQLLKTGQPLFQRVSQGVSYVKGIPLGGQISSGMSVVDV
ncbi:hypothetical protein JQX13_03770 [Archangium violaceum]|uniref:hypothetical protein n=1 Tax=Archangium violaceum TaxID=83451 RepID=UPI00193C28AE|nr:hypothetical protein [Archangium violaceum]QRK14252.1 hypothetical protein JQX13_03770 [Archangium violaceum]